MDWSMRLILIAGYLASIVAIGDLKPNIDDDGGTPSSNSTSSVPDLMPNLNAFTESSLSLTAKPDNRSLEIFIGNISDNLVKEMNTTDLPVNLGRSQPPKVAGRKVHESSKLDVSRKFPAVLPRLEALAILAPYSLPDSFYYEHVHGGTDISTKMFKSDEEFVKPVNMTFLEGQGLLWFHDDDEVIEFFVSRETYPSFISEFKAMFVTKTVNGIPRRLHVLWYNDGEKYFSYEPDVIYLSKRTVRVQSRAKEELEVQYPGGIKHHLYELEITSSEETKGKKTLILKVKIVADFSFSTWFANLNQLNDSETTIEQKLKSLEMTKFYLKNLMTLSNASISNVELEKYKVFIEVSKTVSDKTPEDSDYIERSKVNNSTIDSEKAVQLFIEKELEKQNLSGIEGSSEHVTVILTSYQLVASGKPVTGTTSGLGCHGVILISHKEFHATSGLLLHHLVHTLGVPHDDDFGNCTEGVISEDLHVGDVQTSSFFSPCSVMAMENFIVEEMRKSQEKKCWLRNDEVPVNEMSEFDGIYLGQVLSLDQQCTLVFGPGHEACWPITEHDVCQKLTCKQISDPEKECRSVSGMRAMQGSTCANRSWCLQSVCTHDVLAPEYDPTAKCQRNCPPSGPEQEKWSTFWISLATLVLLSTYVVVRFFAWAMKIFKGTESSSQKIRGQ